MRIWQLCTPRELYSTETGGAVATVAAALSTELAALGHEVTVAARVDGTARYETGGTFVSLGRVPWPATPVKRLRWKAESALSRAFRWTWPAYPSYLGHLWWRLRISATPDVVVAHNDPLVIRYLRRWVPTATLVLWQHNVPYRLAPDRGEADHPDLVITVSDYLARSVALRLGMDRGNVVTIHNGVDAEAFHPREGFDRARTPVRALCLGRLDANKGADVALAAVRRLQAEGVEIELDVVGSPWFSPTPGVPQSRWGADFVAELVAAGAHHIPHVARREVTAIVRDHDISCVLSRWDDPFPLVVLESMASGCAVVATTRGGIPEAAGDAAILVPADDIDAATAALRDLATDPGALAAAKKAARRRALDCTWAAAARRFTDELEVRRRPASGPT